MAKLPKLYQKYRLGHQKNMGYSDLWYNHPEPSVYVVPKMDAELAVAEKLTAEEKLTQITEPWKRLKVFNDFKFNETASRLPDHYKRFYWEWKHSPKTPVHIVAEKGSFRLAADGEKVEEIKDDVIQIVYPDNVNTGLWGGEGVVKGYLNLGRYKGELARYWFPRLQKTAVYSDVLDKYLAVHVTERALDLIDACYGFDHYILSTPHGDLNSLLAFRLKREMLLCLMNGKVPGDDERKQRVLQTYGKYVTMPENEASWLGLTLDEAVSRQEASEVLPSRPYKHDFRAQLVAFLREKEAAKTHGEEEIEKEEAAEDTPWIKKFNPFAKSDSQDVKK